MIAFAILLSITAATTQSNSSIIQNSSGWCSPNIANVIGPVTIKCLGVDPRALKRLNEELHRKNLRLTDAIREADDWAGRYKELESRLSETGDDEGALSRQAADFLHAGELDKAGSVLDQILEKERQQVDRYAANELNRALIFELQFQTLNALPHLEAAYKHSSGKLEIIAGFEYSKVLLDQNDYHHAEPVLSAILNTANDLMKTEPTIYTPYVAGIMNNLALVYGNTGRLKVAEDTCNKSLSIYRDLVNTSPAAYQSYLAASFKHMAFIYLQTGRLENAENAYKEALKICHDLARVNPDAYQLIEALTLNDLANFYDETKYNDPELIKEAELNYKEALGILLSLAKTNRAYIFEVANTRNNLAILYSKTRRTANAEDEFKKALAIYDGLPEANLAAYQSYRAETLFNLADLYFTTERREEAEDIYKRCLITFRDLSKGNPDAYKPKLALVLARLGDFYTDIGYDDKQRVQEAESDFEEALEIFHDLPKDDSAVKQRDVADAMYNLANLYFHVHQHLDEAEQNYKDALGIYRTSAKANPEQFLPFMANALRNLAVLHASENEVASAKVEADEALQIREDLWTKNHDLMGNDLAESLILDAILMAKTEDVRLEPCSLISRAQQVAYDLTVKSEALALTKSYCASR
jgi:tetratricopeptide (TPR) repeat protein